MVGIRGGAVPSSVPELMLALLDRHLGGLRDGNDRSWVLRHQFLLLPAEGVNGGCEEQLVVWMQRVVACRILRVCEVPEGVIKIRVTLFTELTI